MALSQGFPRDWMDSAWEVDARMGYKHTPNHQGEYRMPQIAGKFIAIIAGVLGLGLTAQAGEASPTLQKIKSLGSLTLGHRESSVPFSYYDDNQQVIGYSQELMLIAVEAIKRELGLPTLEVKMMPVTSQNRIPLVVNGTVDLECGSTTNNSERQKQVDFSTSLFIIGTRLLTRKDSGIKDFEDLQGKTLVTTAGTTSERLIRKMNTERNLGLNIISAKDHGESFLTLETGRAVAFMMDDALLFGEVAKSKRPQDWVVTGMPQSMEAYGCMLRKGDGEFKRLVDGALTAAMTSGVAERLYHKWFQSPIPPKGLNLNFPLSEPMRALYAKPNDRAFD